MRRAREPALTSVGSRRVLAADALVSALPLSPHLHFFAGVDLLRQASTTTLTTAGGTTGSGDGLPEIRTKPKRFGLRVLTRPRGAVWRARTS